MQPRHPERIPSSFNTEFSRRHVAGGCWAKYAYNGGGMLADMIHSSGQTCHYDYSVP